MKWPVPKKNTWWLAGWHNPIQFRLNLRRWLIETRAISPRLDRRLRSLDAGTILDRTAPVIEAIGLLRGRG